MVSRRLVSVLLTTYCIGSSAVLAQENQPVTQSGDEVSRKLETPQTLRWVPGQIIVKFSGTPASTDDDRLNTMGFTEHVGDTSGGEYIYSFSDAQISTLSAQALEDQAEAAVQQMQIESDVEYAQLNYVMQIVRVPDDPRLAQQWHYRSNGSGSDGSPGGINLPQAWNRTVGSPEAVIAVIDTGILPDHPDIDGSPNLLPGFDMISDVFTGNDGDGRDADASDPGDGVDPGQCGPGSPSEPDSWHGTHVAGTIGVGRTNNGEGVAGVNWNSRLLPLRALGRCGGSIADINDAIRWAAGLPVPGVEDNPNAAKVINMSLGAGAPCSQSPATQSAINDVVAAGVTVVVAAGNEATDAANSFPASCDNVITVAASDFNGGLVRRYSNFGSVVDIMAPGGDLRADEDNDGNPDGVLSMVKDGYAFFNGTSMAAPHVAGVAGLLVAQDPTVTPQAIENLLKDNALPRDVDQCPQLCGAGLLNADIDTDEPDEAPPPPQPLELSVTPTALELDEGETEALTVTVTRGGKTVAGETVRFGSNDEGVATISPASATSDATGQVEATVTAVSEGNSNIVISVPGQVQTMPINVAIRVVPAIGLIALLLLSFLIGVFGFRRLSANASASVS